MFVWLDVWLVGSFVHSLDGWLVEWLIGSFDGWTFGCMVGGLLGCWLVGWLVELTAYHSTVRDYKYLYNYTRPLLEFGSTAMNNKATFFPT